MRRPKRRAGTVLLALAALGMATTGCAVRGVAFVTDDRVDIVEPKDRAKVRLPVTLRWTVRDFDLTGADGGAFAVFIDRSPPAPGKTVQWLFRGDESCAATAGCPDPGYLADRNIFVTTETSLVLERISRIGVDPDRELHEAIIVLLDSTGRRIGESGFAVEFRVERGQ